MFEGCYTASITPMKKNGDVDYEGLKQFVDFQVDCGVDGILAMGTTGESATLTWNEHEEVLAKTYEYVHARSIVIAGTGSNSTMEAMEANKFIADTGFKAALLVDPYYNGPSSLEIRKEYIEPIARRFNEIQFIPYVIPGRTGTKLLPQDLAILHSTFSNVRAVKEATGELDNMALTRKLCGDDFDILSGDDDKTYEIMTSPQIRANGVISVVSNVAPKAVKDMVKALKEENLKKALDIAKALDPLFKIVTVKTMEDTPYGARMVRARNPLPYKTLMNILKMPSGPCRQPLGKMTKEGLDTVLSQIRIVYETNPFVLEPVEAFFDVDLGERLYEKKYWSNLYYV